VEVFDGRFRQRQPGLLHAFRLADLGVEAGRILGLDRFLLPLVGTPWKPDIKVETQERKTAPSMAD